MSNDTPSGDPFANVFYARKPLQSISVQDFLSKQIPERKFLLAPWLPEQGLAMVHAPRGVGKTWFALNVAWAVASGSCYLGWTGATPNGVLYIDGEMAAVVMQERLLSIMKASESTKCAPFEIITPDLCVEPGMPDLGRESGQKAIDRLITEDIKLIVVDNLSCLAPHCEENKADAWTPLQTWALRHRAAGRSVLFIHHSGKTGRQRGTSRREDVMDTVLGLSRPADYDSRDGAVFQVTIEKGRGILGDDAEPIVAALEAGPDGRQVWTVTKGEESKHDIIVRMASQGMSAMEIVAETGYSRATVYRHQSDARAAGEISK